MIETVSSQYSADELDCLYRQKWVKRAQIKAENFRILQAASPELRTEDGKFVAMMVPNVFSPAEQQRRMSMWAGIKGSLGNRASVFPKDARMITLRKDGRPTGRIGVPERIVKAANGQAVTLGFDHSHKRKDGRWVGRITPDTLRYQKLFAAACVDAARLTEVFQSALPQEFTKQLLAYERIHPDWRIAHSVFTSIYGISMPTACHTDKNDHLDCTGVITASGSWRGGEFFIPEHKLLFCLEPGAVLFVNVHLLHGNLQRLSGHRVGQVHFIRSGMEECLSLEESQPDKAEIMLPMAGKPQGDKLKGSSHAA